MEFVLSGRFLTGVIVGLILCYFFNKRMNKAGG